MPTSVALIVPCYNEAARLVVADFLALSRHSADLGLVFVDDGSTDATASVLDALRRANPDQIDVIVLDRNSGKAEAVRVGLRAALAAGARAVGYCDADLSTPPREILRLVEELEGSGLQAVLGARVRLLGTRIARRAHRHYLGRVFGTVASVALRLPIYDTQCGAKLFRAGPALEAALERPFRSRWIFDVELLSRLLYPPAGVLPLVPAELREVPLRAWRDVSGSKLGFGSMLRAGAQLLALLIRMLLARRKARAAPAIPAASCRPAPRDPTVAQLAVGADRSPAAPAPDPGAIAKGSGR
jgi:glycosyltransferase involved in cell wall biosynthesis